MNINIWVMNIVISEILQSDWAALLSAAVQILYKRVPRPPVRDGRATPNSTTNSQLASLG